MIKTKSINNIYMFDRYTKFKSRGQVFLYEGPNEQQMNSLNILLLNT